MRSALLTGLLACILLGLPFGRAIAADRVLQRSATTSHDPYREHEARVRTVGEARDLPNLPQYSGHARFTHGAVNENAKGGPVYSMSYTAREDAATVMNWYRDALAAAKWELEKESCRAGYLAATDGSGNVVRIAVTNPSSRETRCNFMVQYKYKVASR